MITVTKPYLPDIAEYEIFIKKIWASGWLTNNGPFVQELESKLKDYLGVRNLYLTNNGTIALQIAIKALGLAGEIITTPFSYVATTNSILWENCIPVFADIKKSDFNIDPEKIEALVNKKTSAILATHVYGNPCDADAIKQIADRHHLKVIYDGAHAFGTRLNDQQVLSFGDISTCSFHATKLFHTIEGGCIITDHDELGEKIMLYRQFGHIGDKHYSIGINGKNSEFHAAMGLCVLPKVGQLIKKREKLSKLYDQLLKNLNLQFPEPLKNVNYNYSYYPVFFPDEESLIKSSGELLKNQIMTRRYFFPSLNNLPQHTGEPCPMSEWASIRALALPLYYELEETDVERICRIIKSSL